MLYSVAVYAAMLWALWVAHGHEVNSNQYDDSIVALYHLMFLLLVVVVPFTNWKDAPVLAQYVSSWLRFQTEFRRVTAQTLSLSLRKRAWCLALLVPAASLSLECCYQLLDTSINLVQLVTDVYLLVLRVLLTVVWHFCCRALCKAAEDTLHSFRKELVSVTVSHAVWAEYRILWLSLAKLTRQTGVATCFTFGFFILYMFTKLTLNVYWTINALLFAPTRFFVVAYICITIVNDMILMYVICDNAQTVQSRVGDAFKDTLMDYRTHGIKDSVQDEVLAFLQVIDSCPPVLNLGNFVIVSRRLLISLGSVMVTYLVVLLQFKVSHLSTGKVNNSTSSHNYTNKYG
ncbi:gustatory and odorant receptor 24-like [Periplaneta americana]|uniref:gustatory and odorant receptor 24-like n=1 Tax=Periplaneta americana TaxID=6978 RepID=UPI0037E7ED71